MWLVLRIFVLLLAVVGAGASAFFGLAIAAAGDKLARDTPEAKRLQLLEELRAAVKSGRASQAALDDEESRYRAFVGIRRCWPFVLAGAPLGLLAGLLAMFGRGWSAAALLLAAVVGPLVLFPHSLTLIAVGGLGAAGLLSLLVRPRRPRPAPTPEFALAAD